MMKSARGTIFIHLALYALCAGCTLSDRKEGKPSPDWSRGVAIGGYASGTLGLAVDEADRVHVSWPFSRGNISGIHYTQLNDLADQIVEWDLPIEGGVRTARLAAGLKPKIHLFYARRIPDVETWDLIHHLIDADRNAPPNPAEAVVLMNKIGKYAITADGFGGVFIVGDRGDPGELWLLHIDSAGRLVSERTFSREAALAPSISRAGDGIVHLAWQEGRSVGYAQLDPNSITILHQSLVSDLGASLSGTQVSGPTIGGAAGRIYILWSVTPFTDTESGQAKTLHINFDASRPQLQQPTRLWVLSSEEQPYSRYDGPLPLMSWVLRPSLGDAVEQFGQKSVIETEDHGDFVEVTGAVSKFVFNPVATSGRGSELAVTFVTSQEFQGDTKTQIGVGLFGEGIFRGYAIASKTERLSDQAMLAMDAHDHLHLVWREGASGSEVYYAATSPEVRARLDRLTTSDLVHATPKALTDMVVGLLFTPLVGIWWILPGFVGLGAWKLIRHDQSDEQRLARFILLLALLTYYAVKMVFLPTLFHYTPFSAWIFLPESWKTPLRIAFPPLIFALAFGIGAAIRKRHDLSNLSFYFLVSLFDAAVTLLFYGVTYLGVL
jgi:hypothetical protein